MVMVRVRVRIRVRVGVRVRARARARVRVRVRAVARVPLRLEALEWQPRRCNLDVAKEAARVDVEHTRAEHAHRRATRDGAGGRE
jgi:hypothetical protein